MFNHSLPFDIYNKSCCEAKVCARTRLLLNHASISNCLNWLSQFMIFLLFTCNFPPQACHALEVPLIFHASGPLSFDPSSEHMRYGISLHRS